MSDELSPEGRAVLRAMRERTTRDVLFLRDHCGFDSIDTASAALAELEAGGFIYYVSTYPILTDKGVSA